MKTSGFSVQWWTPTFGGGMPVFANPQSMQFSLPQLLIFLVRPLDAISISTAIISYVGCVGLHRLGKNVLQLDEAIACLLAVAGSTGGFYVLQMTAGHLSYHSFPFIGVALIALVDPSISRLRASLVLGCACAYIVYSGGYFISVITALALLICVPLIGALNPAAFKLKRVAFVAMAGTAIALLLSAARLTAILSLMTGYPRIAPSGPLPSLLSPLVQVVLIPLWILSQLFGGTKNPENFQAALWGRFPWPIWETDASVAFPVALFALYFLFQFLKQVGQKRDKKQITLTITSATSLGLLLVLASAKGPLFGALKAMPLISSLRVNCRFSSALIFPTCLMGVMGIQFVVSRLSQRRARVLLGGILILSVGHVALYTVLLKKYRPDFGIRYGKESGLAGMPQWLDQYYYILRSGITIAPIDEISDVNDETALMTNKSSLRVYEPLIGDRQGALPFLAKLSAGPVHQIREGYFNMNFPLVMAYSAKYGKNSSLVPESERANLDLFLARKTPVWELPFRQKAANVITLLALLFTGVAWFFSFYRKGRIKAAL